MRKFICLALTTLLFQGFADSREVKTFQPFSQIPQQQAPYYGDYSDTNDSSNEYIQDNGNYPKIDQIEKALFNTCYANEDIYQRLNRIEFKLYRRADTTSNLSERMDRITSQLDPSIMYNIPTQKLSQIEIKLFGKTYQNEDTESRIIRMEKEMLGAIQDGNLKERYETVATAAKHYNAFPYEGNNINTNAYRNNNPYIQTSNKGSFLRNLLSIISPGVITGFTPQLYDDTYGYCSSPYLPQYYGNNYNNSSANFWAGGIPAGFSDYTQSNRGYRLYNRNTGTGSGVRILN
ncbi:MAG: hypothetical protein PHV37_05630 [Candidatus Gastranaerophilales bacterium]|nr:hypothetical protein [Candidatus Gastranaerophilales bacterium]